MLSIKGIDQLVTPTPKMIFCGDGPKGTNGKPMRSKLPHIDIPRNKQLWNLMNISYSKEWIILATCLTNTQNTQSDISMPHWHFMQQVATSGH